MSSSILHEEFGLFKNQFSDSVKTDEPPPMFIFEWDEQENDGKVPDSTKRKKGNQKKDNGLKFIFD